MFTLGLPIKIKTFCYFKKDFNEDILKMQAKMTKDLYNFFLSFNEMFKGYKLKIYYDNGQNLITRLLNLNLALTTIDYEFKKEVHARDYRLYQVADFVTTVRLLELKLKNNELSKTEKLMIDDRHLKKNYIKAINKKEL